MYKFFWDTRYLKLFLSKKTQVGLTQWGGYKAPPPQKLVGLKLCWVVVGIAG